jgi:hypothetical protein
MLSRLGADVLCLVLCTLLYVIGTACHMVRADSWQTVTITHKLVAGLDM